MATSYANPDGTGNRTGTIVTVSTFMIGAGGNVTNLLDGVNAEAFYWSANLPQRTRWVRWQFSTPRVIDAFKWYTNFTGSNGAWVFEGSVNGLDFVVLWAGTLSGSTTGVETAFANTDAYTYYRLRLPYTNGAVSSSPANREIEFKIDTGTEPAPVPLVTSYGNQYGSGDRDPTPITVTKSAALVSGSGTVQTLVNGELGGADVIWFGSGWGAGHYIRFAFAEARIVDALVWLQDQTQSHGSWKIMGSQNATDWVELKAAFTLGGSINQETTFVNTTAYLYYQLEMVSGSVSTAPFLYEVLFREMPANADTTPDAFNFVDKTDQDLGAVIESAAITVAGIDTPTDVSVSGEGSPQVRINGGVWGSGELVSNGQTVEVRLTSANLSNTTRTATVTIGGVSDIWSVTTLALQAETLAYLAAMDVVPDGRRAMLINTLITALKSSGAWAKLDCLYLLNMHAEQASRVNAKSPGTKNLTVFHSPTFVAEYGWQGPEGRLHSGWNISDGPNAVRDSVSMFTFIEQYSPKRDPIMGLYFVPNSLVPGIPGSFLLSERRSADLPPNMFGAIDNAIGQNGVGVLPFFETTAVPALWVLTRSSSTALQLRRNTSQVVSSTSSPSVGDTSLENLVGWGVVGAPLAPGITTIPYPVGGFYNGTLSLAGWGAALTEVEADSIYTAWAAYRAGQISPPTDDPTDPPDVGPCGNNYSYTNLGGSGPRTNLITVALDGALVVELGILIALGTLSNLVDGGIVNDANDSIGWVSVSGPTTGPPRINFDFSVMSTVSIKKIKFYQELASATHGTWKLVRWDGVAWIQVGENFVLGGAAISEHDFSSSSPGSSYLWGLERVSGQIDPASWVQEIEFYLVPGCPDVFPLTDGVLRNYGAVVGA